MIFNLKLFWAKLYYPFATNYPNLRNLSYVKVCTYRNSAKHKDKVIGKPFKFTDEEFVKLFTAWLKKQYRVDHTLGRNFGTNDLKHIFYISLLDPKDKNLIILEASHVGQGYAFLISANKKKEKAVLQILSKFCKDNDMYLTDLIGYELDEKWIYLGDIKK